MKKYIQILILLILCGCDIFTVRESEEPDKPPLWNNFYTTWQLAVQNLEYSYEDNRNIVKYAELFRPDFRFYFSPQDINDYNISMNWTKDNEKDMLYNLHNWADSVRIDMQLIPEQNDDLSGNPVKLYRRYTVTAKRNQEARIYNGKMEIQLKQENGFWRILNWYDYRASATTLQPTWGKLKYDFSV